MTVTMAAPVTSIKQFSLLLGLLSCDSFSSSSRTSRTLHHSTSTPRILTLPSPWLELDPALPCGLCFTIIRLLWTKPILSSSPLGEAQVPPRQANLQFPSSASKPYFRRSSYKCCSLEAHTFPSPRFCSFHPPASWKTLVPRGPPSSPPPDFSVYKGDLPGSLVHST